MKRFLAFLLLFFLFQSINSASLDGTSSVVYKSNHYIFSDGDGATGFVKFNDGFTLPEESCITFDVQVPISGAIDLRRTGTLKLEGDLYLDSSVTLSSGGYIYGGDNTIYLGGDLTIPDGTDLIFCFSGVIDGKDHDLVFGRWSQLLIEPGVTVTLKNMRIKNVLNTPSRPPIRCTDWYSKLILDNVIFALEDDFYFMNGQIFIYDDVIFTGSSKFSYRSVLPSYIEPNSTLYFDQGTMFDYYPSSTRADLMTLIDESSSIYLNGATLQTTSTGVRLKSGRLFLDNNVTLSNRYSSDIDTHTEIYSTGTWDAALGLALTHNEKYLAVGASSDYGKDLVIYEWDGKYSLTEKYYTDYGLRIYSVDWRHDDRTLAVAGWSPYAISVYDWDGSTLTLLDRQSYGFTGKDVSWSRDGKFLAVIGYNSSNDLTVYSWDGKKLTSLDTRDCGNLGNSVDWSYDGSLLAIGSESLATEDLKVYSWDGSRLSTLESKDFGSNTHAVAWNPTDEYLVAMGTNGTTDMILYEWDLTTSTLIPRDSKDLNSQGFIRWSYDGKYISVGANYRVLIYEVSGYYMTLIDYFSFYSGANDACWSRNGEFLFVVGQNDSVHLYEIKNKKLVREPQMSNAIIFGDSAKGSDYDLDATLLSGARVEINGFVWDDSAV